MPLGALVAGLLGRADVARWRVPDSLDPAWEERTRLIAELVPDGSRVLEFGAGRARLAAYLDESCSYVPSDLVRRGPDTLVLDLNAQPLPDPSRIDADTAVFAGVLEYLSRVPRVVRWLAGWAQTCIASYECATTSRWTPARAGERLVRAHLGWINAYSQHELERVFLSAGFAGGIARVWHTPEGDEPIFVFHRRPKPG